MLHVVGQQGFPITGDATDLEFADAHPPVWSIEVGVKARAGLQLQHVVSFRQFPDPGKCRVQMLHQQLRASLQCRVQSAASLELERDVGAADSTAVP